MSVTIVTTSNKQTQLAISFSGGGQSYFRGKQDPGTGTNQIHEKICKKKEENQIAGFFLKIMSSRKRESTSVAEEEPSSKTPKDQSNNGC